MTRSEATKALKQFTRTNGVATSTGEYLGGPRERDLIGSWVAYGLVRVTGEHRCEGWVYFKPSYNTAQHGSTQ